MLALASGVKWHCNFAKAEIDKFVAKYVGTCKRCEMALQPSKLAAEIVDIALLALASGVKWHCNISSVSV